MAKQETSPPATEQKLTEMLSERVCYALSKAKMAGTISYETVVQQDEVNLNTVESDTKKDYATAILNYKETIDILETCVISAPEENQQEMFDLVCGNIQNCANLCCRC